jgi:hypothetical protein
MNAPTERPPLFTKERASKEEASKQLLTLLRGSKTPRQSHQIRVWLGAGWITFVVECTDLDEDGCCVGGARQYQRVRDPDLAARIWRTLASVGTVTSAITQRGRDTGKGIEYAVALAQRGLPVAFKPGPLGAGTSWWNDPFNKEIAWANDTELPPTDTLP